MKYAIIILLVLLFTIISCSSKKQGTPYSLSYKLTEPIEFANGVITTSNGISFSNDGVVLYTSKPIQKAFNNGRAFSAIYKYTYKEGKWNGPEQVKFSMEIDAYHPVLSPNNSKLFFNSRSHPDSLDKYIPHNIWYVTKTSSGWSIPKMVKTINEKSYDSYPSIAKNGNLYFNSDRGGGKGSMDIYVSRFVNGAYQRPENILEVNTDQSENDLVVDPNEKFIIFNRYIDSTRALDLYISKKEEKGWGKPIALSKINSPDKWELTPSLSSDGKYFFYELDGKIMQIDLSVVLANKR